MHTDINTIQLAWQGLQDRLKAEHGSPDDTSTPEWLKQMRAKKAAEPRTYYGGGGKPIRLTPQAFDQMFGARKTTVIRSPFRK